MATAITFQFRQQHYRLHWRTGFSLFALGLFLLLCYLGCWQWQRYHFKKELLQHYEMKMQSQPIPFSAKLAEEADLQFQPVQVSGQYDFSKMVLIQNQQHQNQMGYEVLIPMQIANEKKLLLIDLGWIPENRRGSLPTVQTQTPIQGYIKLINEHRFILGKNIYNPSFPLIMQKIDFSDIEKISEETFFPFIVRLQSNHPDGFVRDWIVTTTLPEKHLGYSVQWFVMALVLVIAFFCFCCERIRNEN